MPGVDTPADAEDASTHEIGKKKQQIKKRIKKVYKSIHKYTQHRCDFLADCNLQESIHLAGSFCPVCFPSGGNCQLEFSLKGMSPGAQMDTNHLHETGPKS